MAAYLIFLPGASQGDAATFAAHGLADLVAGGMPRVTTEPVEGPAGRGIMASFGSVFTTPEVAYRDGSQQWQSVAAADDDPPHNPYWLGLWLHQPLAPEEIARPRQHASLPVEIEGATWHMPIARQLPHRWRRDGQRVPMPPFAEFCRQSEELFTRFLSGEVEKVTIRAGHAFVTLGLSLNYYLNAAVVDFLGLVSDESFSLLTGAALEMGLISEVAEQKKNPAPATTPAT